MHYGVWISAIHWVGLCLLSSSQITILGEIRVFVYCFLYIQYPWGMNYTNATVQA